MRPIGVRTGAISRRASTVPMRATLRVYPDA
ncbi:hypothetical protein B1M_18117 [Burkholderia sp. TJI49]|nr:hypothetical protein B1M_18117 [Burkholderia sp. TJI49]